MDRIYLTCDFSLQRELVKIPENDDKYDVNDDS